jgi:hypothetical protein
MPRLLPVIVLAAALALTAPGVAAAAYDDGGGKWAAGRILVKIGEPAPGVNIVPTRFLKSVLGENATILG